MISSNNGKIYVEGSLAEVMTDISLIIYAIKKQIEKATNIDLAKDLINQAVEMGFADEKEIIEQGEIAKEELKMMDAIDRLALGAFKGGK